MGHRLAAAERIFLVGWAGRGRRCRPRSTPWTGTWRRRSRRSTLRVRCGAARRRPARGRPPGARVVLGRDRGRGWGRPCASPTSTARRRSASSTAATRRSGARRTTRSSTGPPRDLRGADRGAAAARGRHEQGRRRLLQEAEELAGAIAAVRGSGARVAQGRQTPGPRTPTRALLSSRHLYVHGAGPALPARLQGRADGRDGEHPHRRYLDVTPPGVAPRAGRGARAQPDRSVPCS